MKNKLRKRQLKFIDKKYTTKFDNLNEKIEKIENKLYDELDPQNKSMTKHFINMISASVGCCVVLFTCELRDSNYVVQNVDLLNIDWGYTFIYGFIGYNIRNLMKYYLSQFVKRNIL